MHDSRLRRLVRALTIRGLVVHSLLVMVSSAISQQSFAQTDLNLRSHFIKDTSKTVINVFGNYFFASNAITNKFDGYYYLTNNFFDDNIKGGVCKNLNYKNYLSI